MTTAGSTPAGSEPAGAPDRLQVFYILGGALGHPTELGKFFSQSDASASLKDMASDAVRQDLRIEARIETVEMQPQVHRALALELAAAQA